jgi:hypothetical protein
VSDFASLISAEEKFEDLCPSMGLDCSDRQNLAVAGQLEAIGPCLPVEFCPVSRNECFDPRNRRNLRCILHYVFSSQRGFSDLDVAIDNLRLRERMPTHKGVGFIVPSVRSQMRSSSAGSERCAGSVATGGAGSAAVD